MCAKLRGRMRQVCGPSSGGNREERGYFCCGRFLQTHGQRIGDLRTQRKTFKAAAGKAAVARAWQVACFRESGQCVRLLSRETWNAMLVGPGFILYTTGSPASVHGRSARGWVELQSGGLARVGIDYQERDLLRGYFRRQISLSCTAKTELLKELICSVRTISSLPLGGGSVGYC